MRQFLYISLTLLLFNSCKDEVELHSVWVKKNSPDTLYRNQPVGFSIGDKGFIGLGYEAQIRADWWEYNSHNEQWTRKKDFPGGGRAFAFCASDGQHGFIGLGFYFNRQTNESKTYKDVWQYDAATDQWSALPDVPFTPQFRITPVSFVMNNQLYIQSNQQLWSLDLTFNTWQRKNDPPFGIPNISIPQRNANAIIVGSEVYVAINNASNSSVSYDTDLWKYIPQTDSWSLVKSKFENSTSANIYWSSIESNVYKLGGYSNGNFGEYVNKQVSFKLIGYPPTDGHYDEYSAVSYSIGNDIYYYFSNGKYWQYVP